MNAEFKAKLIQKDCYFSPPPARTIGRGSILRVREETYEREIKRIVLSYKTPNILDKGVETREETEVEVLSDIQTVTGLVERLGAKPLVTVTKERTEYTLGYEGASFNITLDRVETLGSFVEIEIVSSRKDDVNELIMLGGRLARKIGIDVSKKVVLGYHEMALEKSDNPAALQ